MRSTDHERNRRIAEAYASGGFTTEQIADHFKLKRRRIQQIAAAHGVVRTIGESNRLVAPLKRKRRLRY